jgi:glyoxylase-like metal-dependent hydrolase (beta-lactamase superfamily II)
MIINNDENIISLNTTLKSHVYAIKDSLGYTLIDTSFPGKGKAIIKELKRIKINLKQINKILITHSDIDHIGSAKYLMKKLKCKVYISQAEYDNYLTKSQKIIDELP